MAERPGYNPDQQITKHRGKEETPSSEAIAEKIFKTEAVIGQLRLLPANWKHPETSKTREGVLAEAESYLEQLSTFKETALPASQSTEVVTTPPSTATISRSIDRVFVPFKEDPVNSPTTEGQYVTVNGTHSPVVKSQPSILARWEAIPAKMKVSGGDKFSEVRFIKDVGGLTLTANPGEKLDFSEKLRDQRLESIDTMLRGRIELKTFNELYSQLAQVIEEYTALNPDDEDYDQKATSLGSRIDGFTRAESISSLLSEELKGKMDDPEDFAERVADIIRTVQYLREVDENSGEFVPPIDRGYKLTPFVSEKFAQFATLLNRQMGIGNNAQLEELVNNEQAPDWEHLSAKGMSIIVGPRGTGKNKIVDYYCARTNRPLFRYACSPDKEERDLTYDVELQNGEVVRIPTRILTAVTTPNAMLELDEINLLRPNVAKFFNSLFDGDRAVFLNDQVIKTAPGVIFVGLMNPADYDGVEDLPETIDDRSNIMTMGYPALRETDRNSGQERFTYDEALILKDNISPLRQLSDEQFIELWNYVINGIGTASPTPELAKIVKDLKNLVMIANRTREVVEAYKTRSGDSRMERDISLRGTSEAVKLYSENHLWEANLSSLPGWRAPWNAAQYAIAMTYLPHTDTYRRGKTDRDAIELILTEGVR